MEFSIRKGNVQRNAQELAGIKNELSHIQNDLNSVQKKISYYFPTRPEIGKSLSKISLQLDAETQGMQQLSQSLASIEKLYCKTDASIIGWKKNVKEKVKDKWYEKSFKNSAFQKDNGDGSIISILAATGGYALSGSVGKYTDKDGIYKYDRDEKGKSLHDKSWVKDKNGKKYDPQKADYAKRRATILEGKLEGNRTVSLLNETVSGEYGEAGVDVGKAEMHGSLSGGVYGYDRDGNKVFAPGVKAEAGASVCLLTAYADGEIGNDMLGLKGHGEVSVGKASVEGKFQADFLTEDGKFNPQFKASAEAEAIAVEAKGSASVSIAGVEGTVNGSVNFGIGAHADIGIVDGKIKCDIGASLGVGASLGFEVDTTPLINAVSSASKALWPFGGGGFR